MITIAVTTWPSHPRRVDYLRRTLEALLDNLMGPRSDYRCIVSAESEQPTDAPWAGDELDRVCRSFGIPLRWRQGEASLPAHLNELFDLAFHDAECVLYLQDDWELHRALPLKGAAWLLNEHSDIAGVRLWASTAFKDSLLPGFSEVDLSADWSYGDNPALWHRRWWRRFRTFPASGDFGTHEHAMSKSMARIAEQRILVPTEVATDPIYYFQHIGRVTSVPNDERWPNAPKRSDPETWQ